MPDPISRVDESLKAYATAKQKICIDAVNGCGSIRQAAKHLGINQSSVQQAIAAVKMKAATSGWAPEYGWTHEVPKPHIVSGVSTLYDQEGMIRAQWVKTKLKEEQMLEVVEAYVESIAEVIADKSRIIKPPKLTNEDLIAFYVHGDPHLGLFAWHLETGENFDTEIATADLRAAVSLLVDEAPATQTAVILLLGDNYHADNYEGTTARSGNRLDVDSRLPRVLAMGAKVMEWSVECALKKHEHVIIKAMGGNHDAVSSVALSLILQAHFRNNPRVTVDISPNPFWYYQFGRVMVASTHGDNLKKAKDLGGAMVADVPTMVGQTKFRYFYIGHWHQTSVEENGVCVVEIFRTLAAKDAWNHWKGHRSGRDMRCIIHHKEYGEVQRFTADILRVRAMR